MPAIVHLHEALSKLEEVLVRLVGSEVNVERKRAVSIHPLHLWPDSEWVLDPLARSFVEHV